MAINNRDQLENTQRKIAELELTLEDLKQGESPDDYAVLSEGFIAQIEQMRSEIDHYLGVRRAEINILASSSIEHGKDGKAVASATATRASHFKDIGTALAGTDETDQTRIEPGGAGKVLSITGYRPNKRAAETLQGSRESRLTRSGSIKEYSERKRA